MDLCILTPTWVGYRRLAELTTRVIDRHWPDHPPIFYCGVPGREDEPWLALRDDPADWIGFVHRAVRELRQRGYHRCYLVLEDHLPVFPCHAVHLNRTLPRLGDELDAAYVGLNGWGQGRPPAGVVLGPKRGWLEHLSREFLWKFQLHPALWRLDALEAILEALVAELPLELRTPWAFERRAGRADARIPEALKDGAYRVCGERMTAGPARAARVQLERFAAKAIRFAAGRLLGQPAWTRVDRLVAFLFQYYEGPYPLFLSGIMTKARLNRALIRFLRLHGQRALAREIEATVATMQREVRGGPE